MDKVKETWKLWSRNEYFYWIYSKAKFNIQPYINKTFEATQIIDNLWLGSITSSCNREELKKRNINTIISAVLGASAIYPFDFNYKKSKLRDTEYEDILGEIEEKLPIIHEKLTNNEGVLVHCICGISRSTTTVAAYLIKYKNMSLDETIEFIKSKRSQIDPNKGYMSQLEEFERRQNENKSK